jgi:hypothetical protein
VGIPSQISLPHALKKGIGNQPEFVKNFFGEMIDSSCNIEKEALYTYKIR